MTDLNDQVERVVAGFLDDARATSAQSGRSVLACVMTALRPYIRNAIENSEDAPDPDPRERPYTIHAKFWDVTDGEKHGDLEAEADPATVYGLNAALSKLYEWIREFAEQTPPKDARIEALMARSRNLRSTITRGGGKSSFRVRYSLNGRHWLVVAEVARVEDETATPAGGDERP